MRTIKGGDLYFVFACCLICLFLFFSIIVPKVQENCRIRNKLDRVVKETKRLFQSYRSDERIKWALQENDPWALKIAREHYFQEKQGALLMSNKSKGIEVNAGHSESR